MSVFEQMKVSNAAGTTINPATDDNLPGNLSDALFILRQIRKAIEPLAVQDAQQRQRVVVDTLPTLGTVTNVTNLPTLANVTTVATVTTVTNNVPSNIVQLNSVDPRYMLMDIAHSAYADGIRRQLN